LIAEILCGLTEMEKAPQRRRVGPVGGSFQHPELESMIHLIEAIFEMPNFGSQAAVTEDQGRIGKANSHFTEILHFDQNVDRSVEVGESRAIWNIWW